MSSSSIKETVREYVAREFLPGEGVDSLTDSAALITGGILDSVGTIRLVAFLEETYGIEFDPHEIAEDNLNSIARIANFVESKRS